MRDMLDHVGAVTPPSTLGLKPEGLIARAVDRVFGYDFFISYSHGDGMRLPRRLKQRLEQAGFRVFLDHTEYVAGADLRRETRRQVVKSRKIVVIGRPGALKSEWVRREVDVALAHGKIPVIVNLNGAVEAAPEDAALATMAREAHWLRLTETLADSDGEPSEQTISELVRGFNHTRQETKRQRIFATAAAVLALTAAVATWQAVQATRARTVVGTVQRLARQSNTDATPQRNLLLSVHAASLSKEFQGGKDLAAIDELRQQLRVSGGRPLLGHEKSTQAAVFSKDGQRLSTGSDDGAIRLWNLEDIDSASRSVLLGRHSGPVRGMAFSPDNKWLISGGQDSTLRLWRLAAGGGTAGPIFHTHGAVRALAVSPGGEWLVFGTESGHVCIWKFTSEGAAETPCSNELHDGPVDRVMFSAKGRWLATAAFGFIKKQILLWDFSIDPGSAPPKGLQCDSRTVSDAGLVAISFSLDEARLGVGCGYDAQVWDLTKDNPPEHVVKAGRHDQFIYAINFSPDGRWLATGSKDTNVKLWDLTDAGDVRLDGREVLLSRHGATVRAVTFSDDGRWLATGGDDGTAICGTSAAREPFPTSSCGAMTLPSDK